MFQFPAFALTIVSTWPSTMWVPPFGHLRINSCLQIPGAFRSLPRPSSLSEAKASSVRSSSLSLVLCESHSTTNVSCFYSFCLEIAVPTTRKNSNYYQTIISFFTSLSLSVLSMNFVLFSPPFGRGCKGSHFFLPRKFFFNFFKNIYSTHKGFPAIPY